MRKKDLTITPVPIQKISRIPTGAGTGDDGWKICHKLIALSVFLAGWPVAQDLLLEREENLIRRYTSASVNNKLAAVNGFFAFCGMGTLYSRSRSRLQQKTGKAMEGKNPYLPTKTPLPCARVESYNKTAYLW